MAKSKWLSRQRRLSFSSHFSLLPTAFTHPTELHSVGFHRAVVTAPSCCSFHICQASRASEAWPEDATTLWGARWLFYQKSFHLTVPNFWARAIPCNLLHRYGGKPGDKGAHWDSSRSPEGKPPSWWAGAVDTCLWGTVPCYFQALPVITIRLEISRQESPRTWLWWRSLG